MIMSKPVTVGVVYNPQILGTQDLVTKLVDRLGLEEGALVCTAEELQQIGERHPGVELLITVGGDGTILRAAHIAAPHGVAILGINMGRVGFMTELSAHDALEQLHNYLDNDLWIEERAMLQARTVLPQPGKDTSDEQNRESLLYHALNEAVIGSGAVSRMTSIQVTVDDTPLTIYRADSVIVATATGSTGYALSAGGPILHPLSRDILLMPVAAHMGLRSALVLPATSRIVLTVLSDRPAMLSVDGFLDKKLGEGERVEVSASPYLARFLRAQPPSHHYAIVTQRLGLEHGDAPHRATL